MSEPMQCEKCSYSTFYQVHFRKHYKKMHTGKPKEKQYLCEKCEKTYTYEYELRNHIKVKHQGFRFNCEYCQIILSPGCKLLLFSLASAIPQTQDLVLFC